MSIRKALVLRMLYFALGGVLVAAVFSEISFRLQGNTTSRNPQTIQLVIPPGTSEKVAQGESVVATSQVFMIGDTLEVVNQDSVTQTLGPLVIPPASSARLKLDQVGNLSYTCSFLPSKYYGIQVQEGVTLGMRLQAAFIAGIPLGLLIGAYSLVVKPLKPKATTD